MNPKRAQLLSDGYVILRQVVPPGQLDRLRSDIETVVARQRAGDPEWDRTPQPRASIVDQVDAATIGAFEFLLHPNTHGVSAEVLDSPVEAVASNQALVICNPEFRPKDPPRPGQHWGTDPRNWHRDVRPDRDGPLSAHIEDQLANGPGYVQWNIALYEDHILYVVPGSHRRLSTEIESSHLQGERGTTSPVPESRPVELEPGDGVVYNNLMLHWGSKYGPEEETPHRPPGLSLLWPHLSAPAVQPAHGLLEPVRGGDPAAAGGRTLVRTLSNGICDHRGNLPARPCRETRRGFGPD